MIDEEVKFNAALIHLAMPNACTLSINPPKNKRPNLAAYFILGGGRN
jgi:hypothetical protein